ncbi:serine hydrolase domain-containing protein [Agromyces sp. Soil535]|uniref:serine hydrolase domain-containing protein n=1 Tax=Agromyces sp. Soil535 TaxID=1736390 RepID=UPI0007006840|nr:serine hydrolase domain-containing protein [Agromyces sp. Soil535]KRE30831.1 hypothetical protein ASG80_16400 [Agromyces sp. Soil535]
MSATLGIPAQGHAVAGFEPLREMFDGFLRHDPDYSAQLCIHLGDERVVDLVGGAVGADSLTGVYSVSKGAAALVIARLVDASLLDPDLPVAHYWPEFGAEGKREISVRQALSHQAGVPAIDGRFRLEEVLESAGGAERLAAQRPFWRPGSAFGYHALTIGILMEELVRRVTTTSLQDVFEREIRSPRDADFYLGLPEALDARYVPIQDMRPNEEQRREIEARPPRDALAELVFSNVDVPDELGPDGLSTNNAKVRRAGPAAIGGVGSACGLASLYADALPDSQNAVARRPAFRAMSQQHSWGIDRVLDVANSFGMVFMLPQPRMPYGSAQAFGHDGAGGALAFADPGSGIAFGYIPVPMQFPGGADHRAVALARRAGEIAATLR